MADLTPPEPRKPTTLFGYPVVIKIAAQEIPLPIRIENGHGVIDAEEALRQIRRFGEAGVA